MKPTERLVHLQESDVGRWVVYHPPHNIQERGRIKSFNNESRLAFVVYGRSVENENWLDYTAAATSYFDLEFESSVCPECHDTGLIVGMGGGHWIAGDEWDGDECVEMQDCLCQEGESK